MYSFHGINLQFQRVNSEEVAINPIKLSDKILKASIGWNKANTWPAIVLANTQVKIIEVDHKVEEQITQIWSSSPLHQNQLKSQFSQELNISEKESGDLNLKFQVS